MSNPELNHRGRVTSEYVYGPTGRLATIAVRGDDGKGREEHRHHEGDDSSESVYWHLNDHLGTPQALTDRRGRVVWAADYMPFGNIVRPKDGDGDRGDHGEGRHWKVTNNFRFPGQYYDAETGLNYNVNRDYDPSVGRYIEADPSGLKGGINPYGYAAGDPVRNSDPTGLKVTILINRFYTTMFLAVGEIIVSSDQVSDSFEGYVMEPDLGKGFVADGVYNAWVRKKSSKGKLYNPWRIQLKNVRPGTLTGIQIHNGSYYTDSTGCFLVGTKWSTMHSPGFIQNSLKAMTKIINIVNKDFAASCKKEIKVYVLGLGW